MVCRVGVGVSDVAVGDRVVIFANEYCRTCTNCVAGHQNICSRRRAVGVHYAGAFADFVKVPSFLLHPLPATVSFEDGAMVEPLAVAIHAVIHTPIRMMDTVVIIGAGTIGLLTMMCAKMTGAGRVAVTDKSAHRLAMARALGADAVVNVDDQHPVEVVREITNGAGADVSIEAVGYSATVQQAVSVVHPGGHVTWPGNSSRMVEVDMQDVVLREVSIKGLLTYTPREFDTALAAIGDARIDVGRLVECRSSLEEAPVLAADLAKGVVDYVKVLIIP